MPWLVPCWISTDSDMDVFIDTNVLIDVLSKRDPFYKSSAQVWSWAEKGAIHGLISVISFNNVYYVVRKLRNRRTAERMMILMRDAFDIVALDKQILGQAIDAGFKDFEDAIQYMSAVHAEADCLVSRNPKDFPLKDLSVISPEEFVASLAQRDRSS